jgi:hypothetical protein
MNKEQGILNNKDVFFIQYPLFLVRYSKSYNKNYCTLKLNGTVTMDS